MALKRSTRQCASVKSSTRLDRFGRAGPPAASGPSMARPSSLGVGLCRASRGFGVRGKLLDDGHHNDDPSSQQHLHFLCALGPMLPWTSTRFRRRSDMNLPGRRERANAPQKASTVPLPPSTKSLSLPREGSESSNVRGQEQWQAKLQVDEPSQTAPEPEPQIWIPTTPQTWDSITLHAHIITDSEDLG